LREIAAQGCRVLSLAPGTLVTPLARDTAAALGVSFLLPGRKAFGTTSGQTTRDEGKSCCSTFESRPQAGCPQLVFFSSKGRSAEENLVRQAAEGRGIGVRICPLPESGRPVFPIIEECLRAVADGTCTRAVIVHDEIYAVLRAAKKLPGLRPVVGWDVRRALESRRGNDTNVLLLGNRLLGLTAMGRILNAWLGE